MCNSHIKSTSFGKLPVLWNSVQIYMVRSDLWFELTPFALKYNTVYHHRGIINAVANAVLMVTDIPVRDNSRLTEHMLQIQIPIPATKWLTIFRNRLLLNWVSDMSVPLKLRPYSALLNFFTNTKFVIIIFYIIIIM